MRSLAVAVLLLGGIAVGLAGCCTAVGCGDGFGVRLSGFQGACRVAPCSFTFCVDGTCGAITTTVDEAGVPACQDDETNWNAGLTLSCTRDDATISASARQGALEDGNLQVVVRTADGTEVLSATARLKTHANTTDNGGLGCDNPTCYGGGTVDVTPSGIALE